MAQPSILRRSSISVCDRSGFTKLHIAQEKRERDGSKREHRKRPERYKRGMYRLRLYLLADLGGRPAAVLVRASFREPLRPSVVLGAAIAQQTFAFFCPPPPERRSR